MVDRRVIDACRRVFGLLLRAYPRAFRARFAEGMQQTFHDLCRDKAARADDFARFVVGAFADTTIGIAKERLMDALIHRRRLLRPLLVTLAILAIPFVAMSTGADVTWSKNDFLAGFALLFGTGFALELVAAHARDHASRAATATTVLTLLLWTWTNLAVGLIGSERHPANAVAWIVVAVVVVGAIATRGRTRPMARVLELAAAVQALVPLVAWIVWTDELTARPQPAMNFLPSLLFVGLFGLSASLHRRAANAARATVRPS